MWLKSQYQNELNGKLASPGCRGPAPQYFTALLTLSRPWGPTEIASCNHCGRHISKGKKKKKPQHLILSAGGLEGRNLLVWPLELWHPVALIGRPTRHPSSRPRGLAILQTYIKESPHPPPVSRFSSSVRRLSRHRMGPICHNFSCRQQRLISRWCKWGGGRSPPRRWKMVVVVTDVSVLWGNGYGHGRTSSAEMLPNFINE